MDFFHSFYRVVVLTSWGRSLCLLVGRSLDAKCRKLRGTRNLLGRLKNWFDISSFGQKRSTKAHEIALNYFVLLGGDFLVPHRGLHRSPRGSSPNLREEAH